MDSRQSFLIVLGRQPIDGAAFGFVGRPLPGRTDAPARTGVRRFVSPGGGVRSS